VPMGPPLSRTDIQAEPAREVAYYGGVRQGFEQARAGLEAVVQHLSGLLQKNPNNVRLERYIAQLTKLLTKLHKLQMRSARVRDQRVEKQKPREQGGSWHTPPAPESDFNPGGPASDDETVGPKKRY
jgi:hypothetical protein